MDASHTAAQSPREDVILDVEREYEQMLDEFADEQLDESAVVLDLDNVRPSTLVPRDIEHQQDWVARELTRNEVVS